MRGASRDSDSVGQEFLQACRTIETVPVRGKGEAGLELRRAQKSAGVVAYDIKSKGLAAKAGLADGDVIISINGIQVTDPLIASSLFNKHATGKSKHTSVVEFLPAESAGEPAPVTSDATDATGLQATSADVAHLNGNDTGSRGTANTAAIQRARAARERQTGRHNHKAGKETGECDTPPTLPTPLDRRVSRRLQQQQSAGRSSLTPQMKEVSLEFD